VKNTEVVPPQNRRALIFMPTDRYLIWVTTTFHFPRKLNDTSTSQISIVSSCYDTWSTVSTSSENHITAVRLYIWNNVSTDNNYANNFNDDCNKTTCFSSPDQTRKTGIQDQDTLELRYPN